MSRSSDEILEVMSKPIVIPSNPDGERPEPDKPRLHKIPAAYSKTDRRDVLGAVALKLATLAITASDDDEAEENGRALACICREWNQAEAMRLRAKGGAS